MGSSDLFDLKDALARKTTARRLMLSSGLDRVPDEIRQLRALVELDLSGNALTTLPAWLADLPKLRVLSLQRNRFASLPDVVFSLRALRSLDVGDNPLTTLGTGWSELAGLEELTLFDNKLKKPGVDLKRLAEAPKLRTLHWFGLSAQEIGLLAGLRSLYLGNTKALPAEVGELTGLELLELGEAKCTSLPAEIGSLANLRELRAARSNLEELPKTIGKLTKLETMRLAGCRLKALPDEIASLVSMKHLDVAGNMLTALPQGLVDLPALTLLDVSNNVMCEVPEGLLARPRLTVKASRTKPRGTPTGETSSGFPLVLIEFARAMRSEADVDVDVEIYERFNESYKPSDWTRDPESDDEFATFAVNRMGSQYSFWLRETKDATKAPVVFFGSEGNAGVVSKDVYGFLAILAAGVDPSIVLSYGEDAVGTPSRELTAWVKEHAPPGHRNTRAKAVMAAAAKAFPRFAEHAESRRAPATKSPKKRKNGK